MTVTTYFWPTNGIGDAPLAPDGYGDDTTHKLFRWLCGGDLASAGVLTAGQYDHGLFAGTPGTDQITIAPGAGLVRGVLLESDASEVLTLSSVAATTGGRVVLSTQRTGSPSSQQTGEIKAVQSTSGDTSIPALVQTADEWQVSLYTYQLTNLGVVTLTDTRKYLPLIEGDNIGAGALLLQKRQGGNASNWDTPGTTDYDVTAPVDTQVGAYPAQAIASSSAGTITITFPRPFANDPIAVVSGQGTPPATRFAQFNVITTASQLNIFWRTEGATNVTQSPAVTWVAHGDKA